MNNFIIILLLVSIILLCLFNRKENLNDNFLKNSDYYLKLFNEPLPIYIKNISYLETKFYLLYKKLFDPNIKIVVIGNGPVNINDPGKINNIQNNIKNADVVIRFNQWEESSNVELLGKKCDICFLCGISLIKKSEFNNKIMYIMLDNEHILLKIINAIKKNKNNILNINKETKNIIKKCDFSRGFIALLMLINYYKDVKIIGFGGEGHHNDSKNKMEHNQFEEHKFINKLIKENKLKLL